MKQPGATYEAVVNATTDLEKNAEKKSLLGRPRWRVVVAFFALAAFLYLLSPVYKFLQTHRTQLSVDLAAGHDCRYASDLAHTRISARIALRRIRHGSAVTVGLDAVRRD